MVNGVNMGEALLPMQVIKVSNTEVNIRVMFDNCSQSTFIHTKTAKHLGLNGVAVTYILICTDGSRKKMRGLLHKLKIRDIFGKDHDIEAIGIDKLSSTYAGFRVTNIRDKVDGISICNSITDAKLSRDQGELDLLIGTDLAHLHPKAVAEIDDLILMKSKFSTGWTLMGHHKELIQLLSKHNGVKANVSNVKNVCLVKPFNAKLENNRSEEIFREAKQLLTSKAIKTDKKKNDAIEILLCSSQNRSEVSDVCPKKKKRSRKRKQKPKEETNEVSTFDFDSNDLPAYKFDVQFRIILNIPNLIQASLQMLPKLKSILPKILKTTLLLMTIMSLLNPLASLNSSEKNEEIFDSADLMEKPSEISIPMSGYVAMEVEDPECKKLGTMLLEIRKTRIKFRVPKEKDEATKIEDPVIENDDHVKEAEETENDDHIRANVEHFEDLVEKDALSEENFKHQIIVIEKVNVLMEPEK